MRKCKCGGVITRDDREVCDECFYEGEDHAKPWECVIEYGWHNIHPRPKGVIGLSMSDFVIQAELVRPCCSEMKKQWDREVTVRGHLGGPVDVYYQPWVRQKERSLTDILMDRNFKGGKIEACPYCKHPVRLGAER
jgi:hypothetical protein